jgi:hypothetical protein
MLSQEQAKSCVIFDNCCLDSAYGMTEILRIIKLGYDRRAIIFREVTAKVITLRHQQAALVLQAGTKGG